MHLLHDERAAENHLIQRKPPGFSPELISLSDPMRYHLLFILLLLRLNSLGLSNQDSLRKHVVRLSTLTEARNYRHPEALDQAADYIYRRFSRYSRQTVYQKFQVKESTYKNVLCSFGPEGAPRIIVGAHYDVFGEAPGADNNASGTAALLELARMLSPIHAKLNWRIDLVAYTLSEPPFENTSAMGSWIHARSLKENRIPIAGMINLKGIGFFIETPGSQRYPFVFQKLLYRRTGDFISILQGSGNGHFGAYMKNLMKQYANGLPVRSFRPAIPFPVLRYGDHHSYRAFGYPSLLVSNTLSYRNKYFRYDTDTFETLDYFRMAKVVDMIFQAIIRYS